MKLLISAYSFMPDFGGPARSVPQLAQHLAILGAEVTLWAPDGSAVNNPLIPSVSGLRGSNAPLEELFHANRSRFDLIHDNGIWQPHHRALSAKAHHYGQPLVISIRGMLEPWALKHKKWKKQVAWWAYQKRDLHKASILHATAASEAKQLRSLGLKNKISVIPNGVSLPPETTLSEHSETFSGERTCLFLSRIHPKKGIPLLLKAWAKVGPTGWRLKVAGPDENNHLSQLVREVDKLGIRESVEFTGPLEGDEKKKAFKSADLFVLPTFSENFGIVVAEALSYGCPVITTHGAPWSALEEHDCGWWIPAEEEALVEALRNATCATASRRKIMGKKGRELVSVELGWAGIARDFFQTYQNTIS